MKKIRIYCIKCPRIIGDFLWRFVKPGNKVSVKPL